MIVALLTRLGVDPIQWRALLMVAMRIDFPVAAAKKTTTERRYVRTLAGVLLLYTLFGVTPALIAYWSPDPLLAAASLSTIVGFVVASTLLMGEGSNMVSPSDHEIIGFRPVTSRTYLAVRISALLVRTFAVAGAVAVIPMIVFLLRRGFHPGLAIAAFLTAQVTGVSVALGIAAMYGWMLKVAGPARMMRYTAYLQFFAMSFVWVSMIGVSQGLNARALAGVSLSATSWWIALPPAWFGSYVMLAAGQVTPVAIIAALLSVGIVAMFGWLIRDKLSLSYVENLARLATVTTTGIAPKVGGWMAGLSDETRAVAILVRSQLEHDMKFRLGLMSLLPLTVIYMYLGGWPHDPFVPRPSGTGGSDGPFIQLALVFLPMTLRQAIISSESYRASWIFHTTPADRGKLVLSSRNVITAFFLVPYLVCLAVVFAYAYGNATHALIHAAFLALVSWLVLQLTILISPQLPFSMAHGKDAAAGMAFVRMMVSMMVGLASYFILVKLIYKDSMRMAIAAGVLIALGLVMDWLTRWRVRRRPVEKMYFD